MLNELIRCILFLVTVFVTNTIQVITGFAGAMLAMPPSIHLIGFEAAKAILNIVTMASCVYVVIRHWKSINFHEFRKMILLMGIGLLAGIWLLDVLALTFLLKAYGLLIIGIALKKLLIHREFKIPKWLLYLCLLAAGLIHGMFLSGGSFLIIYAVSMLHDKEEFRSTVSAIWVVLNSFLLFTHYQSGYFKPYVWILLLLTIIPFLLAVWIGNLLASKISTEKFLTATYILLLMSGFLAFL